MEIVGIRQLKGKAQAAPQAFEVHGQLATLITKMSRGGKPFFEARFADAGDQLTLRIWEDSVLYRSFESFQPGDFILIVGDWIKSDFGIEPREASAQPLNEDQLAELLIGPSDLRAKQATDFQAITDFVGSMKDPRLQALGESFLAQYGSRFQRTAAARTYHHARRGGLVEHVAQMMRSADAICGVYPELNRDLVLSGVLFHDCGKLWENCYAEKDFTMPHTEVGELLGHIPFGMELVNKLWRDLLSGPDASAWTEMTPSNDQVRLHLLHLIASHHGEYEFGSPTLPRTPEAAALHYVDNLDAKLEMFAEGYGKAAPLGKNIFERVRPLPGNLVRPLPSFDGGEETPF